MTTLYDELSMLRERVHVLEARIRCVDDAARDVFGLSAQQARIVRSLTVRKSAEVSEIIEDVWPDGDEPECASNQIKVVIFRIRRKLKPFGVTIKSRVHYGYWIDEPDCSRLRVLLGLGR